MPDPVRVRVDCEGPDDKAVLDALQKGGVLSPRLEIAKPSFGESNLARDVAPFVSPDQVDGRALILRDLDDLDAQGGGHRDVGPVAPASAGRLRMEGAGDGGGEGDGSYRPRQYPGRRRWWATATTSSLSPARR